MIKAVFLLLSLTIVAVLVYSSIFLPPPPQVFASSDKWLHFAVYAALGCWFGLMQPRHGLWVLLLCITLGFGLEYLQGLTAYRQANFWDGFANALGSTVGLVIARLLLAYMPARLAGHR